MEKRRMENLSVETSLLGFGCMRFPVNADGTIHEEEAEKMIDTAMKAGVNYYDTAYPYHDGASEPFVGKVLNKYDRSSYYLATKLPVWLVESQEDGERIFNEQLKRLDKEYIDFYLLHSLDGATYRKMKSLGIVELCERLQKEGKIRYLGFSFHDEYEAFEEIITDRKWDFCQIQFNYMDTEEQAGLKGYALAEKLGVPLIIMEPVRGGSLAGYSEDINAMFAKMNPKASIASYALRWVGTFSNVKVILSGMSTSEQLQDNLRTFSDFKPLSEQEQKGIEEIAGVLRTRVKNGCTGCRYCMPCPAGVNIPANFKIWNTCAIYQKYESVQWAWESMEDKERANVCIKCGKCEAVCPQKISIRKDLETMYEELNGYRKLSEGN